MAKTLDELMKENPNLVFSQADLDMGRDQPGMLEKIAYGKTKWGDAETQEEKDYWNKWTNTQRMYNGGYDGGADGLEGQYSPQYHRPSPTAQNDNVAALYEKYNNLYGKKNAPTWTPQYQNEISSLMADIGNIGKFSYDMNTDPLYQQYRDQYIREGQKAMRDSAAQSAALTGGYGSTYGAIAAQQGYDNYLAQLNDRVPQLEQQAYGKYVDEIANMYNQLGAYQNEENRLYGQYMDAMDQYNIDRNYAFDAMNAAISQNNYENEFNRGIFESDRDYNFGYRQQDIENAAAFGDWDKVEGYDYDVNFMRDQQAMDELQMAYNQTKLAQQMGKLQGMVGGTTPTNTTPASPKKKKPAETEKDGNENSKPTSGYTALVANYKMMGDTEEFMNTVNTMKRNGMVTDDDYEKFLKAIGK